MTYRVSTKKPPKGDWPYSIAEGTKNLNFIKSVCNFATMNRKSLFIGAMALGTLLHGCNTAGCTDNQNSLPLAGFYLADTGEPIAVDSLAVWGVGAPGDSMICNPSMQLQQIYLPLRSSSTETSYCFHYANKALEDPAFNDTVTFRYTSRPYFASEECGAMYRYTITEVAHTSHIIQAVEILDSLITNTDRERIKIWFR